MDWGMKNRLSQLMPKGRGFFMPIDRIEWEEVDEVAGSSRGGWGSTGH